MKTEKSMSPEQTASCTECTGLIPALPEDFQQAENEAELYGIHPPEKPRRKMKR